MRVVAEEGMRLQDGYRVGMHFPDVAECLARQRQQVHLNADVDLAGDPVSGIAQP